MSYGAYILIFIITLCIQIYARNIYLKLKSIPIRSNYSGMDICSMLLSDQHIDNVNIEPLKNRNNYEFVDLDNQIIYLKRSVYYGKGASAIAIAAQRTFLYIYEQIHIFGRFYYYIAPYIHLLSYIGWITILISIITQIEIGISLGIVFLIISFLVNLIFLPIEKHVMDEALFYLEKNIIEEEELIYIKKVLFVNMLFIFTNYSQAVVDSIYYLFKQVVNKIKYKKMIK